MNATITNLESGETIAITRDVTTTHPKWVHAQCGTSSEGELQRMMDSYCSDDFYATNGTHLGPDNVGVACYRD